MKLFLLRIYFEQCDAGEGVHFTDFVRLLKVIGMMTNRSVFEETLSFEVDLMKEGLEWNHFGFQFVLVQVWAKDSMRAGHEIFKNVTAFE